MHRYKSQKHQKRIKDQAIDLCKNEAGKKKESESMGGNSFARKSIFNNSAQNVTFKFLADEAKKSNMIKVPIKMKGKV